MNGKNMSSGYEPNDKLAQMGPTTHANGSTYTGERHLGKKHGHGV